jgi:aspartate aminotransferase-like enzyme
MSHPKLFLTGPIEVRKDLLQAQTEPMIGHRSPEYSELHSSILEKFRKHMNLSTHEVFIFTSSATGVMEAAIRNCVQGKVLHTINGSFSQRWHDVSLGCAKETGVLEVDWGKAIKPEDLSQALSEGNYQAVTITHNETSTGVMNPLGELIKIVKEDPPSIATRDRLPSLVRRGRRPMVFVDAVSSFGGTVIKPEELGIDVLVFGTQKCLGLPPGLAFAVVSPQAMELSTQAEDKGYYFDFQVMKKYNDKNQTPSTPAISLMRALDRQLDKLLKEGMEPRAEKHAEMASLVRNWCEENKFSLLAEKGFESSTVTAAQNTPGVDIDAFRKAVAMSGFQIANAYGKLKGQGFRVGHMGDWQPTEVKKLLSVMTKALRNI